MKQLAAYIFGFGAFFVAAIFFAFVALLALDREADNRASAQIEMDKRMLLKVPAIYKGRAVDECVISDAELRCAYRTKLGEYKILEAK